MRRVSRSRRGVPQHFWAKTTISENLWYDGRHALAVARPPQSGSRLPQSKERRPSRRRPWSREAALFQKARLFKVARPLSRGRKELALRGPFVGAGTDAAPCGRPALPWNTPR